MVDGGVELEHDGMAVVLGEEKRKQTKEKFAHRLNLGLMNIYFKFVLILPWSIFYL